MAETAASGPGMPQLDITTFSNQIFWLVVALVVLYYVMSRVALPRVASVLADRRGAITADIAAAEEYKQKALDAEEAFKKAEADARAEAQRIVEAAKAEMQEALNAQIAKADAEIAAKSAESEKRIRDITANAVEMVGDVSNDVTKDIVAAFDMKADARSVTAAVKAQMKGNA
ncbi:MAG: F-type H+-transporting ATPase beta' subunit AtpF' [Roseibaca calidilacus]|uniref:ATP synthase subunit b n=1 Tax=Roseibaca calidilacus TaxID=1666912 RepID=A0A0P7YSQ1_9RHOB|nr:F0F1 ATP synthase subunit B' [Roseibaca calidilacus]KPP92319.1 MAG: F-type H+-transporting ATPase beta' subunit AtpF' [Roseibaca calidilacus]CUX79614.1 F-type H+-transporting ATPase subunit b [Roseibaca calidilacus]